MRGRGLFRSVFSVVVLAIAVVALAACGSSPTATPTPKPTNTPVPGATNTPTPTVDPFAAQWQAIVDAAKAEGQIDVVAGGVASRTYGSVVDYFGQKYGIKVNFSTGSSSEQSGRILAERANGQYTVDIAMTGANTSANAYIPAGALDPVMDWLVLPDVLDQSNWYRGHFWWGDEQQKYNFIFSAALQNPPTNIEINTEKVNPDDITSVWDFLTDKYKGHLAALPPDFGGAQEQYFEAYMEPELGPDFVKKYLQDMDVFFSTDYTQIENQLAAGDLWATIFAGAVRQDVDTMKEQGLPVDHLLKVVKEPGELVSGGSASNIGVFNKPAHPNAAKLFINWWLSKEGQTQMHLLSDAPPNPSLRVDDIPDGVTLEEQRRTPGVVYPYTSADAEALTQREDVKNTTIQWYNESH